MNRTCFCSWDIVFRSQGESSWGQVTVILSHWLKWVMRHEQSFCSLALLTNFIEGGDYYAQAWIILRHSGNALWYLIIYDHYPFRTKLQCMGNWRVIILFCSIDQSWHNTVYRQVQFYHFQTYVDDSVSLQGCGSYCSRHEDPKHCKGSFIKSR